MPTYSASVASVAERTAPRKADEGAHARTRGRVVLVRPSRRGPRRRAARVAWRRAVPPARRAGAGGRASADIFVVLESTPELQPIALPSTTLPRESVRGGSCAPPPRDQGSRPSVPSSRTRPSPATSPSSTSRGEPRRARRRRWRRRASGPRLAAAPTPAGERTARVLAGYRRTAVGRGQARPFVAADLAAVLATCHRTRRRGRGVESDEVP